MNPDHFRAICRLLWGDKHTSGTERAAEFLGISPRNANYFAAGAKDVPDGIARELGAELRRCILDRQELKPEFVVIRDALLRPALNK